MNMPCNHKRVWEMRELIGPYDNQENLSTKEAWLEEGFEPFGIAWVPGGILYRAFKRLKPCEECANSLVQLDCQELTAGQELRPGQAVFLGKDGKLYVSKK